MNHAATEVGTSFLAHVSQRFDTNLNTANYTAWRHREGSFMFIKWHSPYWTAKAQPCGLPSQHRLWCEYSLIFHAWHNTLTTFISLIFTTFSDFAMTVSFFMIFQLLLSSINPKIIAEFSRLCVSKFSNLSMWKVALIDFCLQCLHLCQHGEARSQWTVAIALMGSFFLFSH